MSIFIAAMSLTLKRVADLFLFCIITFLIFIYSFPCLKLGGGGGGNRGGEGWSE